MNIIYLIIIGILGIIIGSYFGARKNKNQEGNLISEQSKQKQENKQKILDFLNENERITNDDVEKMCEVSDNTAERYLNELEKENILTQHGEIGRGVFYTLKNK